MSHPNIPVLPESDNTEPKLATAIDIENAIYRQNDRNTIEDRDRIVKQENLPKPLTKSQIAYKKAKAAERELKKAQRKAELAARAEEIRLKREELKNQLRDAFAEIEKKPPTRPEFWSKDIKDHIKSLKLPARPGEEDQNARAIANELREKDSIVHTRGLPKSKQIPTKLNRRANGLWDYLIWLEKEDALRVKEACVLMGCSIREYIVLSIRRNLIHFEKVERAACEEADRIRKAGLAAGADGFVPEAHTEFTPQPVSERMPANALFNGGGKDLTPIERKIALIRATLERKEEEKRVKAEARAAKKAESSQ